MDRKILTHHATVVAMLLSEQGGEGMPNGHVYAFLQCEPYCLNLESYQYILAFLVNAKLVTNSNHWLALTEKGRAFIGELKNMASKTKASAGTAVKGKTAEELQEILVTAIAKFPTEFKLQDHKGVCMIAPSKSSIDPETGEESIAVVDKKGELVSEFTAKELTEKLVPVKKGGKGGKVGQSKSGKEPHVERMRRLVLAGATSEEIFAEFKKVFTGDPRRGQHENASDDASIKRRIYLYTWRCADRYKDVAEALKARKETRKKEPKEEAEATPKAAKGKKAAKKADKAAEETETAAPKAAKKKAGKKAAKKEAAAE